ncbi:hypothetical protein GPECTOR_2g1230 [Gonium pectorale]|uniref:Uncharacterized protein n=1 Tax=Gonium pectorale TaxID=33097 RepID=A0A150H276_GONPE|nr:hypothetical protein GPECTOR_2g1230 [Gonium pectorale]|eukprot:KXZ55680.1 hypothetical protein GPECTOR_2g1230 [Gonium pectorale]
MAAASMPLVGAGAAAAMPGFTGACPLQAAGAMWSLMGCAPVPPAAAPAVPGGAPERACSAASSDIAFPSTSCSNSVPTIGGISAPASPPPLAASPVSVCNGSSDLPAEDDEFATFIDSFLRSGDSELTDAAISSGLFKDAGASTSGDSGASATVPEEEACLTRSDSHNLLHLLGSDLDVPGIC